jgi:hypothetical protein
VACSSPLTVSTSRGCWSYAPNDFHRGATCAPQQHASTPRRKSPPNQISGETCPSNHSSNSRLAVFDAGQNGATHDRVDRHPMVLTGGVERDRSALCGRLRRERHGTRVEAVGVSRCPTSGLAAQRTAMKAVCERVQDHAYHGVTAQAIDLGTGLATGWLSLTRSPCRCVHLRRCSRSRLSASLYRRVSGCASGVASQRLSRFA